MLKNKNKIKQAHKHRRQQRTRAKVFGTATNPRLNVSKSLNHVYLQLIDDNQGKTLVSFHSKSLAGEASKGKVEIARQAGLKFAQQALEKKITKCVFDRSSSIYHGRIKAVAEGARAGGLKF